MPDSDYRYWAFISYSHQDRVWGNWLHRTLETYRVPARLVGRPCRDGKTPSRLFPIFRDRDELPSAHHLGDVINESLRASRYQIVICSPRSAASKWVNAEVAYFKSLGRADRVLCLIVEGEPNVIDLAGRDIEECFAPALRFEVDQQGQLTSIRAEPIAADARRHGDGREGAKLKLIAGMLGIGLDELRQRERQRALVRSLQWAAFGLAALASLTGLWTWEQQRRAAITRDEHLARLVELGRVELSKNHHARAATYLAAAYQAGVETSAVRFMLAQALPSVEAVTPFAIDAEIAGNLDNIAAWSPDGRLIAAFEVDREPNQLWIWESRRGKTVTKILAPASDLIGTGLRFSADGHRLLAIWKSSSTRDRFAMTLLDVRNGLVLRQFSESSIASGQPWHDATMPATATLDSVALIADDGHVRVVEAVSGGVLLQIPGIGNAASASFSRDGRRLVVNRKGVPASVWNLQPLSLAFTLPPIAANDRLTFFSPADRALIGRSADGRITAYSSADGQLIGGVGNFSTPVRGLTFSDDGGKMATVALEGYAVWDFAGNQPAFLRADSAALTQHVDSQRVEISPQGDRLIETTAFGAEIWDLGRRTLQAEIDAHGGSLMTTLFAPGGERLLTIGADSALRISELGGLPRFPTLRLPHQGSLQPGYAEGVYSARFDRSGRRLVTAGMDGTARVWDAASAVTLAVLSGHTAPVKKAEFSTDDQLILTTGLDQTARLWDSRRGTLLATWAIDKPYRAVKFSPDGTRATVNLPVDRDRYRLGLRDVKTGAMLHDLDAHADTICDLAFSPDGRQVTTASWDHTARIWDTGSGKLLHVLDGHRDRLFGVAYSPDGTSIVTTSDDASARLWSAASGKLLDTLQGQDLGQLKSPRFSRDGQQLVIGSQSGAVALWTPAKQRLSTLVGHTQDVLEPAFSFDEAFVAAAGYDNKLTIWDAVTGALLMTQPVNVSYTTSVSPDGSRIATAGVSPPGGDNSAQLWDLRLERRSPAIVSDLIRCKSPWALTGEQLTPKALPADCAG